MLNKICKVGIVSAIITSPIFAFAQFAQTGMILASIKNIITAFLIPIVFTLALLFFFWGVVKYIWSEGQGKEDGRKVMVWGIVALFVMSSVWGIVRFLQDQIGLSTTNTIQIPSIGT
mgnify:CR=1 FL=1